MVLALVLAAVMQLFSPDINPGQNSHFIVKDDSSRIVHQADSANTPRYVTIDNILVIGNRITKSEIILREIDVAKGQTVYYDDLIKQLKLDQERVNNLRLFNTVKVKSVDLQEDRVLIVVEVTERWYIFPIPIFDLVDRNFNVWWEQQNHDFRRVNYGLKLYQRNFRGRNEKLKLTAQFGFTKKFGVSYAIPYLDKAQKHGVTIDAGYSENKNIAIRTRDHIQEFFNSEEILRTTFESGFMYVHRNTFHNFHNFGIKYINVNINDTISTQNPNYFRHGKTQQQYFRLFYQFIRDKRDVQAYPLNGYWFEGSIWKSGVGVFDDINQTEFRLRYAKYIDFGKQWYASNYSSLYLSKPDEQPYNSYYAIGYFMDMVRGYELYLIEGPRLFLNKSTIKKRVFSMDGSIGAMPLKQFRHFPLDIYIKSYVDWGYVQNFDDYGDNIRFSDSYLLGGGMGLDIHTFYDMVIRLEYSINKEKETGFYFHLKKEF